MLGLGIDTGGTYTDAVVYDLAARKVVASAKALTTRQDLAAGIREVLTRLPAGPLREVAQCSLSTTLATNACVEGKGAQAALVLLGFDRELLAWLGPEYGFTTERGAPMPCSSRIARTAVRRLVISGINRAFKRVVTATTPKAAARPRQS